MSKSIKVVIAKNPGTTSLHIGKSANKKIMGQFEGVEYSQYEIELVYGLSELVEFALEQEFRLGTKIRTK